MVDPYKEDLNELQDAIKKGILFTTSYVMRRMRWGYNRTKNTIDLAVESGVADELHKGDMYVQYRFV